MKMIQRLRRGCESLSKRTAFLKEWWTNEASLMCSPQTWKDTTSVTSLPESADGLTLSVSQASPTMSPSRAEVARAPRFQPQEKRKTVFSAEIEQSRIRAKLESLLASD